MGPFAYRSWVEISLQQIADNFQAVRDVVGPAVEVMPVVKADAYRHGAIEVSKRLTDAGARWLAVSNVEEGAIMRERGITTRILVMADFLPAERAGLLDYNLTPVIHSLGDIQEWNRLSENRGVVSAYHLKIDSGMGRLGTRASASEISGKSPDGSPDVCARIRGSEVAPPRRRSRGKARILNRNTRNSESNAPPPLRTVTVTVGPDCMTSTDERADRLLVLDVHSMINVSVSD